MKGLKSVVRGLLSICISFVLLGSTIAPVPSALHQQMRWPSSDKSSIAFADKQSKAITSYYYLPLIRRSGTTVCGEIKVDTTWTSFDSPYRVTCDVLVPTGVTLNIEAGVTVQFRNSGDSILVAGSLQALGTPNNVIRFQPASTTTRGSWGRVAFNPSSSGVLEHALLEYGGSNQGMVYIASDAVQVKSSVVQYSADTGIYIQSASPLISDNQILNNWGSGVFNDSGSPTIQGNRFTGNSANYGGGLYIASGNPIVQNNTINGNSAMVGGGINDNSGSSLIQNNVIFDNTAASYDHECGVASGGGIYILSANSIIQNNTIYGNQVLGLDDGGGGIYNAGSSVIRSNIVAKNISAVGGIYNAGMLIEDYNDVWGNSGEAYRDITPGAHDISINPLLADPANGNFHLTNRSGCIDAGDPIDFPADDFEGDPRPGWFFPDIGADEFHSVRVLKSSAPSEAQPGNPIAYTVNLDNLATSALTNVQVIDTLPVETAYTGYQADGLTCTHDGSTWGGQLSCTLDGPSLAPNENRVLTVNVLLDVNIPAPRYITNTITVMASTGEITYTDRDWAQTWATWCSAQLNNTPMGSDLQAAIDASSQPSDVLKVSGYCIVHDLNLDKTLTLQGGWSRDFSRWDSAMYTTTLDEQKSIGRVIRIEGVVSPLIEGFVIRGGNVSGSGGGVYISSGNPTIQSNAFVENVAILNGGGIYIGSGSPLIQDNTFTDNAAIGTYSGGFGGAIYNNTGSPTIQNNTFSGNLAHRIDSKSSGGGLANNSGNPNILDNTFTGNSAVFGGGIYNETGSPLIQNNTFTSNTANVSGGGLNNNSGSPTVQNNTFTGNSALYGGGGGMVNFSGSPVIQNNTFSNNTATSGGGLGNYDNATIQDNTFSSNSATYGGGLENGYSDPILQNNTFTGNSATYGGGLSNIGNPIIQDNTFNGNSANQGGGIFNNGDPTIQRNIFNGNSAHDPSGEGFGGGLYHDASEYSGYVLSSPTIQNNEFTGNSADRGGGMYIASANLIIQNNDILSNSADRGGGLDIASGNPSIYNNIITSNTGSTSGGGINVDPAAVFTGEDYNNVWNNIGGNYSGLTPGLHDISADPLLVDPASGDFHLAPGSPCIDAGNPITYTLTDFEGQLRPMGLAPDIGIDEYVSLRVKKDGAPTEALPGDSVTYRIVLANPTTFPLTQVMLTDTLPGETAFTGYQSTSLTCTHDGSTWGGALSCTLEGLSLGPGDSQELTVTVNLTTTFSMMQHITNTVTASATADGNTFIARDQARTWVSWCEVRLNDTPMGDGLQTAINASTQTTDAVKVSGICRVHDLVLNKTLALQGGWRHDFVERDPARYPTTLDGQGLGRVLQVNGAVAPTIDGFIITGGETNDDGGGISISSGSPVIQNNAFTGNSASYGGGVYNGYGSPTIQDNAFTDNSAVSGGGLYNGYGSPMIQHNSFTSNSAFSSGGGLYNDSGGSTIENNAFTANSTDPDAGGQGGGLYNNSGSPVIQSNTFTDNSSFSGGGVYNYSGSPSIQDNIISGNSVTNNGGGMQNATGNPFIQDNTFTSNSSSNYGAGFYNDSGNPLVQNNIFASNSAAIKGGGLYNDGGALIIQNNTFFGNSAWWGGGIYNGSFYTVIVRSNILVDNTASLGGGGISSSSCALLDYNDVWNNAGGDYDLVIPGVHDISFDPLMVDPLYGDFHLSLGSPCIDAGDPVDYPLTDFEGDLRPNGSAPDIGADEYY
jgi:uncharacterized repeat protein (TIGR01451 family)